MEGCRGCGNGNAYTYTTERPFHLPIGWPCQPEYQTTTDSLGSLEGNIGNIIGTFLLENLKNYDFIGNTTEYAQPSTFAIRPAMGKPNPAYMDPTISISRKIDSPGKALYKAVTSW